MIISRFFRSQFSDDPSSLQEWRDRILVIFLWTLVIFGTLAYVVNVISALAAKQYGLIIFYTLAFLWVIINAVFKRIPYRFRAGSMLVIAYSLVPITFANGGLIGDGRVWLMFFIIYSTILFGLRAGIFATLLSTFTYITFAILVSNGTLTIPALDANDPSVWIATGVVLLWLSITVFTSAAMLFQGLERTQSSLKDSLETEKELNLELGKEHELLTNRSGDLERRLVQIRAAADISRLITAELNPQILMQKVVDLIKERFELYYAGVFLMDETKRYAVLQTGTGEPGQKMVAEGHKLTVGGTSMVGWATANRQARIALDVGQEAIRFNNPHLPRTRSELALPLLRGQEPIGALTIQSTDPEAFDEDDIVVLQGIADSLATAIENAQFFQQIEDSLEEIKKLNRLYLREGWSTVVDSDNSLSYTAEVEGGSGEDGKVTTIDVPLMLRDQQVIGTISLQSDRKSWSQEEMEFIDAVSNQAAIALESARLLDESQKRVQREQALNELTARFSRSLDVDTLMQVVVQELGKLPKVSEVSLHMSPPKAKKATNIEGKPM